MSEKEKNEKKLALWLDAITVDEAATLIGKSVTTIDNYIKSGILIKLELGQEHKPNVKVIKEQIMDLISIGKNVKGLCEVDILRKYAK